MQKIGKAKVGGPNRERKCKCLGEALPWKRTKKASSLHFIVILKDSIKYMLDLT